MLTRRNFLIGASATLRAPAVVKITNLMPVRGIILPVERHYFGFVERLYVSQHLREITELKNVGMSAAEIAAVMNGRRSVAMNGRPWDVEQVSWVDKQNELIRRSDVLLRAEKRLGFAAA